MSNERTVVDETKGAAKPASAESSAPDDLDTLLNEFETGTKPKVEQPKTETKTESNDEVVKFVREERERRAREEKERQISETNRDIGEAVKTLKEGVELPVKVSDRVIRGYLEGLAAEDPRFANAFVQRHQNPQAWKKVLKGVQKQLVEEFSIDPNATQDREAVAAAVRGASSTKPEPQKDFDEKEIRKMSHHELLQKFPELS